MRITVVYVKFLHMNVTLSTLRDDIASFLFIQYHQTSPMKVCVTYLITNSCYIIYLLTLIAKRNQGVVLTFC